MDTPPAQPCPPDDPEPPPSTARSPTSPASPNPPPCPRQTLHPPHPLLCTSPPRSPAAHARSAPAPPCASGLSASRACTSAVAGTRAGRGAKTGQRAESSSTTGGMGISGCLMISALRMQWLRGLSACLGRERRGEIGSRTASRLGGNGWTMGVGEGGVLRNMFRAEIQSLPADAASNV